MRRLWSHIVLAATSLLMVGGTFASTVAKAKSNIEFSTVGGKELVFQINAKNPETGLIDKDADLPEDAVNEIASIMESRLQTSQITRYEVKTQGDDTVRVSFVGNSERDYEIIQNYLTFDATLALSNAFDNVAYADEFLVPGKKAYMEITSGYPQIIIPINSENERFKAVYEEAKQKAENGEGEVKEEHEEGEEEGEHDHATHAYLYLWYNYIEDYYSYDKMQQDESLKNKILMTFDSADPFADEDHTALRAIVAPSDANKENATITPDQLRLAYENARYYVNLLNASSLDYFVTFLFSQKANVIVENLLDHSGEIETLRWGRTFIATICAVVVVSLLLVYFYRLGSLSIATTSIVATFFGLLFIVTLGAEFNIAGIIGLISLALTSIVSGVVYLNKFKEECYRGRSLKKANAEGAKKAVLPIVDLHVVLIALGVACYLLGGAIMKSFAVSAVLGGLVSLVLNLAGLRGLMWLVTNEQGIANRYDLFDISEDQVPNALTGEKQKYFGANADKDFTKSKKPVAIAALVLFVASIAGLITFGALNKGAVYQTTSPYGNSQVYIEYGSQTEEEMPAIKNTMKNQIDDLLDKATIGGNKLSSFVTVEEPLSNPVLREEQTGGSSVEKTYYSYYLLNFDRQLEKRNSNGEITSYENINFDGVDYAADKFFETGSLVTIGYTMDEDRTNISLKDSVRVNADQPSFASLILATAVGTAIAAAYLLLRYRLSRGLASLAMTVLSVGISAGIFSLLHFLPVTSYVSVALPLVAIFTFMVGILYMNKERELVVEDRSRDNSVENRNELMKKAVGIASTPMTISFIIALYLGVNFFGFMPNNVSWIFLLLILGVTIAIALGLTLYGPCAQLLFKWFSKVNIAKPKLSKKKKARPVRVNKSAEPEEAIFIGIND